MAGQGFGEAGNAIVRYKNWIRENVKQADPSGHNWEYVMSPGDDSPRLATTMEREVLGLKAPDLCTCGPKTRATVGCECAAIDDHLAGQLPDPEYRRTAVENKASSFFFFETLLDEAHPSSKMFYEHLIEAALLHRDKQRDYGKESDPFANVRASEDWGIPGWVGCMVRANDKIRRLQTLATEGTLTNEAARDSFLDLAVYALIGLCLFEQESQANRVT